MTPYGTKLATPYLFYQYVWENPSEHIGPMTPNCNKSNIESCDDSESFVRGNLFVRSLGEGRGWVGIDDDDW